MIPTPIVPDLHVDHVYEPAEDTFLFLDLFEQLHNDGYFKKRPSNSHHHIRSPLVVELGSGSGVISTLISSNEIIPSAIHLAVDINQIALKTTLSTHAHNNPSKLPFDAVRCDLTTALRPNQIDVMIFNPPYVPSEEIPPIPDSNDDENSAWIDLALVGGDDGMLITRKVLDSLDTILAVGGEAYILFCARNKHKDVTEQFAENWKNFSVSVVIERKCGWEELAIYRFTKTF